MKGKYINITTIEELNENKPLRSQGKLKILLLCDDEHIAGAVKDHYSAICNHSEHIIFVYNPITKRKCWGLNLNDYDAVIIHYSICILYEFYLPDIIFNKLKYYQGIKIQIIQDEHRWVNKMICRMQDLSIDAVLSSLITENIKKVYDKKQLNDVTFVSSLPGYIAERYFEFERKPISARKYHLVYRGRTLDVWHGKFAREKSNIGKYAEELHDKYGFNVDCKTDEENRIYGSSWDDFLETGKATLAVEGGSSVFDFEDDIQNRVNKYYESHPLASSDEVWKEIVLPYEGNIVHKTITPKVFEAIAHKTVLIMSPGNYRDILTPWLHYIPLNENDSDHSELAKILRDDGLLTKYSECAYEDIMRNKKLHYKSYVAAIDYLVTELKANNKTVTSYNACIQLKNLTFGLLDYLYSRWLRPYTTEKKLILKCNKSILDLYANYLRIITSVKSILIRIYRNKIF